MSSYAELGRSRIQPVKTLAFVVMTTFLEDWLPGWIPINQLPLSHFWQVILIRTIMTIIIILAMRWIYPGSLQRVLHQPTFKKKVIALGIIAYLTIPPLLSARYHTVSILHIVGSFVFALFIGIHEEFFSRGLIFASLHKYGLTTAAVLSSIHFGVLHLGNFIWGGQSFSYTLGQMLSAGAFGYLCAGLMIFTGNIWYPILLHGLNDTSMQFESSAQFSKEVTGHSNWLGILPLIIVYLAIGWALIKFRENSFRR